MNTVTFTHNGVAYSMTEEQIEAAYEYQRHQFLLSDAEDHLRALCFGWDSGEEYNPGDKPKNGHISELLGFFEEEYGISFDEAMRHLESYVVKFETSFNQNLSEDEQWDYAIQMVIKENLER